MKIGMILRKTFPPDIRVEKEIRTLIANKYEVSLLCYKKQDQPKDKIIDGLKIQRIEVPWKKLVTLGSKWNALKFHLFFENGYWTKEISKFAKNYSLDVLHVHDLPLLGTTISVGEKLGIPVIADLHENYPAVMEILNKDKKSFWERFCTNPKRWSVYERKALFKTSKIIVVVKEAKERLLQQYKIPEEKITTLMNVVDTKYFSGIKIIPEILNRYKEHFLVLYIGGGGAHRGLETTIYSFTYLRDVIPNIKLLLIGLTGSERNRLLQIREQLQIQNNIDIIGWEGFERVPSYIKASDICLVPHKKNYHTDTTIPHKLFQYMFNKKPVVVSDCNPLKRIVEETSCGLVFKSGDPKDLAFKIIELHKDKKRRITSSQKGYDSVINNYNWNLESKKLVALYKSLT